MNTSNQNGHGGVPSVPDRASAMDPQPGASFAELNFRRWLGDGRRRNGVDRADVVHDNTLHAGLAVAAVQAFRSAFVTLFAEQAVDAAVRAYRAAASLGREDADVTVIKELLCGLQHLADAREFCLIAPEGDDVLTIAAFLLRLQIERVAVTTWAERLGEPWEEIEATARRWYADQVRPKRKRDTHTAWAVWVERDGEFLGTTWILDELLHRTAEGACAYCREIDDTEGERSLHTAAEHRRAEQRHPRSTVRSSAFEIPDSLHTVSDVHREITRQITGR